MLPATAAVVHLTGGALVIDSLMTSAIRASIIPGQDFLNKEESIFADEWDSECEKQDKGVGQAKGRKKKVMAAKTKTLANKKKSKPRAKKPTASKKKK